MNSVVTNTSEVVDKTPSVIHKVRLIHKEIYTTGHKLSKRDKLGIHRNIEEASLKLLASLVEAAFTGKTGKQKVLETARIEVEILKHLIRTENELSVIDLKTYMRLAKELVEISKMINGWISYATKI